MKLRKHLLRVVASAHGSPGIQRLMAKVLADATGESITTILKDARAFAKADAEAAGVENPVDVDALVVNIGFEAPDTYYVRSGNRNAYEPRKAKDIDLLFMQAGLSPTRRGGELSQVDNARMRVQAEQSTTYAGPQTAHRLGFHQSNDGMFLVTREPHFLEARQGDPSPFIQLTRELCGVGHDPHGQEQFDEAMGWLKQWDIALTNPNSHIQGQILGIGGPPGLGKSRWSYFGGLLGGGRVSEPARVRTNFNSERLEATLEIIHDAAVSDKAADVRELWLQLKTLVANRDHRIEAKYGHARTMPLAGKRSIVTFNLGEEAAKLLQPWLIHEPGMAEKIIFIRGHPPTTPYPKQGTEEGTAWVKHVVDSLPAFLWWLRNEYVLPEGLRDERFGVRHFCHPEIRQKVMDSAADHYLGEYIDDWIQSSSAPWVGTMAQLHDALSNHYGQSFRSYSHTPQHMGHQLNRLLKLPGWSDRLSFAESWEGPNHKKKVVKLTITLPTAATYAG